MRVIILATLLATLLGCAEMERVKEEKSVEYRSEIASMDCEDMYKKALRYLDRAEARSSSWGEKATLALAYLKLMEYRGCYR